MEIDSIRKLIAIIDLETGSLEHVVAYIILIFGNTWLQALGLIVFSSLLLAFTLYQVYATGQRCSFGASTPIFLYTLMADGAKRFLRSV